MNSFAHYSFGAVCEWMFSQLAGIDSDGAGYKRIIIRPMPPSPESNPEHKPIDWVRAHYDSIHGRIASAWKREGERFELEVTIPANTTATVYFPARDEGSINESGKPLGRAKGAKFVKMESDRAVLSVESGSYRFATKL
jgi:alpha-L-rhamnosidase